MVTVQCNVSYQTHVITSHPKWVYSITTTKIFFPHSFADAISHSIIFRPFMLIWPTWPSKTNIKIRIIWSYIKAIWVNSIFALAYITLTILYFLSFHKTFHSLTYSIALHRQSLILRKTVDVVQEVIVKMSLTREFYCLKHAGLDEIRTTLLLHLSECSICKHEIVDGVILSGSPIKGFRTSL